MGIRIASDIAIVDRASIGRNIVVVRVSIGIRTSSDSIKNSITASSISNKVIDIDIVVNGSRFGIKSSIHVIDVDSNQRLAAGTRRTAAPLGTPRHNRSLP